MGLKKERFVLKLNLKVAGCDDDIVRITKGSYGREGV